MIVKSLFRIIGLIACIVLVASCSDDDENNYVPSKINVYGIEMSRAQDKDAQLVFTGDNIDWFNPDTREIKFKNIEPSASIFPVYSKIEFRIGENMLFSASSFVMDCYSQSFLDLVLYYSSAENRYYLDDCYPNTEAIKNTEEVKEHIIARESQWDTFIRTLQSEKRIRR